MTKKYDDFDLDVIEVSKTKEIQPRITSISLCTTGCKTSLLTGCSWK